MALTNLNLFEIAKRKGFIRWIKSKQIDQLSVGRGSKCVYARRIGQNKFKPIRLRGELFFAEEIEKPDE